MMWSALMIVVVVVVVVEGSRYERQASKCSREETCQLLSTCGPLQNLLRNPTEEIFNTIYRAECDRGPSGLKVCCPGSILFPGGTKTTTATTPINPERLLPGHCLHPIAHAFFGETITLIDYIPSMAALGFDSTTNPSWSCGGTLINNQYVLTAAHCVHPNYTEGRDVVVVRLGELNLSTNPDCETRPDGRTICAPPPQDFVPTEVIIHKDFNKRGPVSDDIALIRLDREYESSRYINPACIPPAGESVASLLNGRPGEVSGWGLTETFQPAEILQRVYLPLVDKATCNPTYNNMLVPEQVCLGGGKQDSCNGDSGGPVLIPGPGRIDVVGIVSFGRFRFQCGVEDIPAVYTDVTAYRDWILLNLRP